MRSTRVLGVDLARGLAALVMIQGHAYDGWVADASRSSAGFFVTRVLGTLPLPAFLLLAGASVAYRLDAATRRREPARELRARLVRRGLQILAVGYACNVVSALIDGFEDLTTFLRADVLHVIGLSILVSAGGVVGDRSGAPDRRAFSRRAAFATIVLTLVCPSATQLGAAVDGPIGALVGLLIDVRGYTRMPLVPLGAWFALGALVGLGLIWTNRVENDPAGAPRAVRFVVIATALAVALVGTLGTAIYLAAAEVSLSRSNPSVWLNVIDLAGRGGIVLGLGLLLTPKLPAQLLAVLLRFGRGSLWAYAFHIPFCYGTLARPMSRNLDMWTATAVLTVLLLACYALVVVRERVMARA